MASHASPVPRDVELELRRVVDRWHQLPLDHASSHVGEVRALAQALADETSHGDERDVLPDLGPAVLMDQLQVTVYDACVAGLAAGLAKRLAELRRALA